MGYDYIYDISNLDLSKRISIQKPNDYSYCVDLKNSTPARLCVGKAGNRYKTETYLRLMADHAAAMDSVWSQVDETIIAQLGFFMVKTISKNKEEFITMPSLGGKFSEKTIQHIKENCVNNPDIQIIVSDGLNSVAINNNIKDIYLIVKDRLFSNKFIIGTSIFVKYGTVAIINEIKKFLNAKVTVLFIGGEPGLAIGENISAYILANTDGKIQNICISNINKKGIPPVEAGAEVAHIIEMILQENKTKS